jgi:Ca2+/Na+ antiporter
MNDSTTSYKRKAIVSVLIGILFLITGLVFASLGVFVVWIASGVCAYSVFLTTYYLVLAFQSKQPFKKKLKQTPQEKELQAYIRSQIPMLVSIFMVGILIVVIVLLFFA